MQNRIHGSCSRLREFIRKWVFKAITVEPFFEAESPYYGNVGVIWAIHNIEMSAWRGSAVFFKS